MMEDPTRTNTVMYRVGAASIIAGLVLVAAATGGAGGARTSVQLDAQPQPHGVSKKMASQRAPPAPESDASATPPAAVEATYALERTPAADDLLFTVSSAYATAAGESGLYPWKLLIEPHREATFTVADLDGSAPPHGVTYQWTVDGQVAGHGTTLAHTCQTRWYSKSYLVKLTETVHGSDSPTREFETQVMCKYVRRELRSLTDADREAYLAAHQTLYTMSEEDGQAQYGPKFHNKDYFNRKHAGLPGCSAYHKGAQFIGSHMALTLEFEQALQAVDPTVTVPYWDWTMDDAQRGGQWRESEVFADDWFGSASPANEDAVIDTGRWAYTPILTKAWDYSQKTNPYGYMTDAWNMIKKPFLSRSDQLYGLTNTQPLPTCGDHYMCLTIDNWMDFTHCIEFYAHENVHQLLGGVTHSESTLARLVGKHPENHKLYLLLASRADRAIMALHTNQILTCPDYCALDTPFANCSCSCPTLEADGGLDTAALSYLKDDLGVFDYLAELPTDNSPDAVVTDASGVGEAHLQQADISSIKEMLRLYCNPGMIGDQYTSFATNDPVFWLIHPTLERLWHLKRLTGDAAFDETWEDWDACPGHNQHDILPFEHLVGEKTNKQYTNRELYDLLDPSNPDLPYLYDDFQWEHCAEKGLDLVSAPTTLVNAGVYKSYSTYTVRIAQLEEDAASR